MEITRTIDTNNPQESEPLKVTWQELADQGYAPINHIMKDSFDWSSIPEDKKDLVGTVIAAEMDAVEIEQERAAAAQTERDREAHDASLEPFRKAAKASGEIATRQTQIIVAAEQSSQPVTVHNGAYITPNERAEMLAGDRDTR